MKISLLIGSIMLMAATAFGQQMDKSKKTPEEHATKRSENLKKELNLTDDQYNKIYQIHLDKANAREMKRANKDEASKMSKETRMAERKKEIEELDTEIKSVLTEDQIVRFEELKSKRKEKKGDKKNRGSYPKH